MKTVYSVVGDTDLRFYEINEVKEMIKSINSAIDFIISIAGDYCAALDFLREHKIEVRLDDEQVRTCGMSLLAELREIRIELEGQLDDKEGML